MSEGARNDLYPMESGVVRLSADADLASVRHFDRVPMKFDSLEKILRESKKYGETQEKRARQLLDFLSDLPIEDSDETIEEYKLQAGLLVLPKILRGSLKKETLQGMSILGDLLSKKSSWDYLYRIDSQWLMGNNLAHVLDTPDFDSVDFLDWMRKDLLGADLLTRDLKFMVGEDIVARAYGRRGFDRTFSEDIRVATFKESKHIIQLIKNSTERLSPKLIAKLEELTGKDIHNENEAFQRVQFVSLDRGGRLLLYGILNMPEFKYIESAKPSSAFFGIKVDTSMVSLRFNNPTAGYDVDEFEKLSRSLEESGKDILVLVDLYGGTEKTDKQIALNKIFLKASSTKLEIVTVGISNFNTVGLDWDPLVGQDDRSRAVGLAFRSGKLEVPYSIPPYPWKWLLHDGGEDRLRQYLGLSPELALI
jgi:hypothetical protein